MNYPEPMPIRVLHIFAPNFKHRFGGPIFDWKFAFSRWKDPSIQHLVLDSEQGKILEAEEAFNFPISNIQYIASRKERFLWIYQLLKLVSHRRKKYDILHLHILWWASLFMGVRAHYMGIPAIYQSVLLFEDTPGGLLRERLGKLQVWCLRKFKAILAISPTLAKDYLDHGFSKEQVFMLMNPVDTEIFRPSLQDSEKNNARARLGLSPEHKVLLFVGSVIRRKGVDVLVDAFIKAREKESNLKLLIVGARQLNENPSIDLEFVSELRQKLRKHNCENAVTFTGLVQDRNKLAEIYRATDVFVFPSRNEGLGNVVLEAMASGLPVIVSRLPVLEAVIEDGKNGMFVPVDDSFALSAAINRMWYDWDKFIELGLNARAYIESKHQFSQWQSQMTDFYQKLIQNKAGNVS